MWSKAMHVVTESFKQIFQFRKVWEIIIERRQTQLVDMDVMLLENRTIVGCT